MLEKLRTENRNSNTMDIDEKSIIEILKIMNEEDKKVPIAIQEALPSIALVVEKVVKSLKQGGRLIYIGAGTSGRLGVLDAAECPPTYGTDPNLVMGLIAGGEKAFIVAVEGAEDNPDLAVEDLKAIDLNDKDIVIGIAASGRTPYVIGGLKYAKEVNAQYATISCNKDAEISKYSEVAIEVDAGPEVITGSTRLKAGTVQKNVLNMISTTSMVALGKVYQNLMVDMQSTNQKLEQRAIRMILEVTDITEEKAVELLKQSNQSVKLAIFMALSDLNKEESAEILNKHDGYLKRALAEVNK